MRRTPCRRQSGLRSASRSRSAVRLLTDAGRGGPAQTGVTASALTGFSNVPRSKTSIGFGGRSSRTWSGAPAARLPEVAAQRREGRGSASRRPAGGAVILGVADQRPRAQAVGVPREQPPVGRAHLRARVVGGVSGLFFSRLTSSAQAGDRPTKACRRQERSTFRRPASAAIASAAKQARASCRTPDCFATLAMADGGSKSVRSWQHGSPEEIDHLHRRAVRHPRRAGCRSRLALAVLTGGGAWTIMLA